MGVLPITHPDTDSPISSSVSSASCGSPIKLEHHILSAGEWKRTWLFSHPSMPFTLSVCKKDYRSFSLNCPNVASCAIDTKLDSCAQSCLWSLRDCLKAGFKMDDLIPVKLSLSAANKSRISIAGALLIRLNGKTSSGKTICATMVYVSPDADGFFLSLEAMLDLGLINRGSELCPSELSGQVSSHSVPSTGTSPNQMPLRLSVHVLCEPLVLRDLRRCHSQLKWPIMRR